MATAMRPRWKVPAMHCASVSFWVLPALLSGRRVFLAPQTAACAASLSLTFSRLLSPRLHHLSCSLWLSSSPFLSETPLSPCHSLPHLPQPRAVLSFSKHPASPFGTTLFWHNPLSLSSALSGVFFTSSSLSATASAPTMTYEQ